MYWGFYKELQELQAFGQDADFGILENVPVGDAYYLYDFLHGCCDQFAVALSDFFGYEIEYILVNDVCGLVHAYCICELANGEKAYIDARGITTDAELFFAEFSDWCNFDLDSGSLTGRKGDCQVLRYKNTKEMYADKNRAMNQDEDLYQFLTDNRFYYDMKAFELEYSQVRSVNHLLDEATVQCEALNKNVILKFDSVLERE